MHAWDNVKLAHHYCNSTKSDILPSELELDIDIDDAYALAREVSPRMKEVKQLTKEGKLINIYKSTAEAEKQTGVKVKEYRSVLGECKTYRVSSGVCIRPRGTSWSMPASYFPPYCTFFLMQ